MTNVWVVRADFGRYAKHFVGGGYAAAGWIPGEDLGEVEAKEFLYPSYERAYPEDTSKYRIGQNVGQIARFLLDIKAGDYVITPDIDTEKLHYGKVAPEPYSYSDSSDGCSFPHRRRVEWASEPLNRSGLSIPLQNTLRSSLTIFGVSQSEEFLSRIGEGSPNSNPPSADSYEVVLRQILELDAEEFEILVGHLLSALGFESTEVTGKSGDDGVDVTGELSVSNLAKVRVFVQCKRYQLGAKIKASDVKALRGSIPRDGQGAFITTANYQRDAENVAVKEGFPRIGLINGHQLVDLLTAHWGSIPVDFQERLGLKSGLVRA